MNDNTNFSVGDMPRSNPSAAMIGAGLFLDVRQRQDQRRPCWARRAPSATPIYPLSPSGWRKQRRTWRPP